MMNLSKIEELAQKRGRSFRILIVDDEPRVQDVFREFCTITPSVEVDLAANGLDAVKKVAANDYDLVTMDLIMPEMAGVEAVTKIKELKPHLPVIIITGNATERLINQAGIRGAASLLYKPVLLEDFVEEVTLALQKSATGGAR
ncbi:putative Chemotaxis protein CheY [Candidatus Zixiibacteriota bacterium]|nr:putative Chemotaxis protein CheY [candidate division Zixibacteria bacterium]